MDLKMNYNSFIKLKDFFKVLNISAEIDEYNVKNDTLEGVLHIKGKYLRRDNVSEEYFLEKIPFSIVINDQDFEVEDINCIDFEYIGVEGRGVDVSFDILVKYYIFEEVPVVTSRNEEMVMANSLEKQSDIDQSSQKPDIIEEEHSETDTLFREEGDSEENLDEQMAEVMATPLEDDEFETLKKEETERIDNLLKSTLSFKDDNLPTEEIVIRGLKDTTILMKVYYYKNDAELERVCNENNMSLDTVFKKNQKFDFNKYHRVIINDK